MNTATEEKAVFATLEPEIEDTVIQGVEEIAFSESEIQDTVIQDVSGELGKSLLHMKEARKSYPLIVWAIKVLWGTGKKKPKGPKAPTSCKISKVEKDAPKPTTERNHLGPSSEKEISRAPKKTTGGKPNKDNKSSTEDGVRFFVDDRTCREFLDVASKISGKIAEMLGKVNDELKYRMKVFLLLIKLWWKWIRPSKPDFVSFGGEVLLALFALFVIWEACSRRCYAVSPLSLVDVPGENGNPHIVHRGCR